MSDTDPTESPSSPRTRVPGRQTIAEGKLAELQAKVDTFGDEEDSQVVEVAAIHAEVRKSTIDKSFEFLREVIDKVFTFLQSANFRWLLAAITAILLVPLVITGTWAINGGIVVVGWGCYGTAAFCAPTVRVEAERVQAEQEG